MIVMILPLTHFRLNDLIILYMIFLEKLHLDPSMLEGLLSTPPDRLACTALDGVI
jgi:hypothetical protein